MGQPKGLPVCPSSASWCVETEFMLQSLGPGGNPTQRRDSDGDTALLASQLPSLIRRGLRQASSGPPQTQVTDRHTHTQAFLLL